MRPGGLYKGDPPPLYPGAYQPRSLRHVEAETRPNAARNGVVSSIVFPNGSVAATGSPALAAALATVVLDMQREAAA